MDLVVRKSGYIDSAITVQVFIPGLLDEQRTFEAGFEAPDNVTIPLSVPDDDIALEPDEVHVVTLSLVTSPDRIVLSPSEANVTVIDDDDREWMCTYIYILIYYEPFQYFEREGLAPSIISQLLIIVKHIQSSK